MNSDPIACHEYERGRNCNYWTLDPTLQFEARRVYPDDEYEWAGPVLSEFDGVLGHGMAETAERIDKEGHEFRSFDRYGDRNNEVAYHPLVHEQEAIAYEEFGITHDAFHAPPGREEPVGLAHTLMMQTLLSYADSGFCCPVSMTTGAAIVLEKFDDGSLREYFEGLTSRDLVDMAVDYEAAAVFSFEGARLLDERERTDAGSGDDIYRLMRLFVPVAKYKTARMAVETTSYAMEILGGNGYVHEHTTERLLRDAQVLPIWEGPSNVLALDTLRALNREGAHEALLPYVREKLDAAEHPSVRRLASDVEERFHELQTALATLATEEGDYAQYHAKRLADLIFDFVTAVLLLEEAQMA